MEKIVKGKAGRKEASSARGLRGALSCRTSVLTWLGECLTLRRDESRRALELL